MGEGGGAMVSNVWCNVETQLQTPVQSGSSIGSFGLVSVCQAGCEDRVGELSSM